jgi:ABC-type Fe3+ transport system substrate-binding protein
MKQIKDSDNAEIWGLPSFILKTPLENEIRLIKSHCSSSINIQFATSKQKRFLYEKLDKINEDKGMPDILFRSDFKGLVQPNITNVVKNSNEYVNVLSENIVGENFKKIGFLHPEKKITMLGAKPWVIVMDHSVNKNVKAPMVWEDLLSEEYENMISIQGKEGKYCGTLLMYFYKEFGEAGLVRLANLVKNTGHFTQLIRGIGRGYKNSTPISIMPLVNAKLISNRKNVEIIWPKDGALLTPVYMFVKKQRIEYIQKYVDFFTSDRMAEILRKQFFLTVIDSYKSRNLKWIGWDFINSIDMNLDDYKEQLNRLFEKNYKGGYYAS